jgi:hypothetical protein
MNFFLRLKHWQLFILMIIVPIIVMIAGNPFSLTARIIYGVVAAGSYFGWLYSLGIALNKKLPKSVTMNLTYFRISFSILIFFFLGSVMIQVFYDRPQHEDAFIMLPIIIFLQGCVLYMFYFISKSLNMVELQRDAIYGDYADDFFRIWFYPIGIWNIQPRVNDLFKNDLGKTIS